MLQCGDSSTYVFILLVFERGWRPRGRHRSDHACSSWRLVYPTCRKIHTRAMLASTLGSMVGTNFGKIPLFIGSPLCSLFLLLLAHSYTSGKLTTFTGVRPSMCYVCLPYGERLNNFFSTLNVISKPRARIFERTRAFKRLRPDTGVSPKPRHTRRDQHAWKSGLQHIASALSGHQFAVYQQCTSTAWRLSPSSWQDVAHRISNCEEGWRRRRGLAILQKSALCGGIWSFQSPLSGARCPG